MIKKSLLAFSTGAPISYQRIGPVAGVGIHSDPDQYIPSPCVKPAVFVSVKAANVVVRVPEKLTVTVSPTTAVVILVPPAIVSVSV